MPSSAPEIYAALIRVDLDAEEWIATRDGQKCGERALALEGRPLVPTREKVLMVYKGFGA